MKKIPYFLVIVVFACIASHASPENVGLGEIDATAFGSFSSCVSSPSAAGKTIVITSPLSVNKLTVPKDRHLRFSGGGQLVVADGETITLPVPDAGRYKIFGGAGKVKITGGTVYPEWWGARSGNGATNASANVAAVNAALSSGLDRNNPITVSLEGLYYVDNRIYPKSASRLVGRNNGCIKAVPNISIPIWAYLVDVDGQSDVIIDSIEIDGNRLSQHQDSKHSFGGIICQNSTNCSITNNKIHDTNGQLTGAAAGHGIRTLNADNVSILNNMVYSCNGDGINLFFNSTAILVSHNVLHNNSEIGIESEGRKDTDYRNHRNHNITIVGNIIRGHSDAKRISDHSILLDWTDSAIISNNQCLDNRHNGIEVLGCRSVSISNNICQNNGDVGYPYVWAGISVVSESFGADGKNENIIITGNQIKGSQFGINIDTVSDIFISGNFIAAVKNCGVMIGKKVARIKLIDNTIESTKDAISLNSDKVSEIKISDNTLITDNNGIAFAGLDRKPLYLTDFDISSNNFANNNNGMFSNGIVIYTSGKIESNIFKDVKAYDLSSDAANSTLLSSVLVVGNVHSKGVARFPAYGIPTSGTWKVGDLRYDYPFAPGAGIGYVCTEAGTPGIWKRFGSVMP